MKRWLVLTVEAPSEAHRDALVEGLLSLGGTSVQENGVGLTTYIVAPPDAAAFVANARATLRDLVGSEPRMTWTWQDDEDWTEHWKRGLRPRRVGRHFIIAPSWTTPEPRAGDQIIVIDPEMAFGTGEHATTRGALRFLEEITQPGDRVLDVGTGSAILAIGAAMLGAREVRAVDNDADALLNARDNVRRNRVADVIRLEEAAVDASYLRRFADEPFNSIVANVLSSVLRPLLPEFFRAVAPGGHVILGGILESEADDMLDACDAAGFRTRAEDLEQEWWGVLLQRPLAIVR